MYNNEVDLKVETYKTLSSTTLMHARIKILATLHLNAELGVYLQMEHFQLKVKKLRCENFPHTMMLNMPSNRYRGGALGKIHSSMKNVREKVSPCCKTTIPSNQAESSAKLIKIKSSICNLSNREFHMKGEEEEGRQEGRKWKVRVERHSLKCTYEFSV